MAQLDFYALGPDERNFLDYAMRDQGLLLFRGVQARAEPDPPDPGALPGPHEPWWQSFYLAPRGRAAEVRYVRVPTKEYYAMDMHSPVLRWMRSGEVEGRPLRGWIYLNTELRPPHEVEIAYRRLEAWIRRAFRPVPGEKAYAGPESWAALVKTKRP